MPELPPLPPRPTAAPASQRPAKGKPDADRARPDARPMRVVYGAGAVAAVSVMTIGLVQPAWDAQAQPAPPTDTPDAGAGADPGLTVRISGNQPNDAQSNRSGGDAQVRHVTRYIHLKPGQQAPPGATVITPGAPTPRVITVHNQPASPPTQNHQPAAAPPPPPPARPPAPPPPPRTTTHQSGHPR